MKKLTSLFIVLCITATLFALEEVRWVQTRVAKYPATEDALDRGYCCDFYNDKYHSKPSSFAGFELTNENGYPVWVEMELYRKQSVVETKNITLKAGESYLWKVNIVAECQKIHNAPNIYPTGETCSTTHIQDYFIKYKAYKAQ